MQNIIKIIGLLLVIFSLAGTASAYSSHSHSHYSSFGDNYKTNNQISDCIPSGGGLGNTGLYNCNSPTGNNIIRPIV